MPETLEYINPYLPEVLDGKLPDALILRRYDEEMLYQACEKLNRAFASAREDTTQEFGECIAIVDPMIVSWLEGKVDARLSEVAFSQNHGMVTKKVVRDNGQHTLWVGNDPEVQKVFVLGKHKNNIGTEDEPHYQIVYSLNAKLEAIDSDSSPSSVVGPEDVIFSAFDFLQLADNPGALSEHIGVEDLPITVTIDTDKPKAAYFIGAKVVDIVAGGYSNRDVKLLLSEDSSGTLRTIRIVKRQNDEPLA